ncbi:MAG: TlpA family protein disulfide reductase [Fimbriimonadaceae bacterium]
MKVNLGIYSALIALVALPACLSAQKVGEKAPDWSETVSTGKRTSGAELQKNGPYVLYFIKIGCPVNEPLVGFYNQIAQSYKGVQFLGVIDGNAKAFESWNKKHKVTFPVVLDPNKKVIKAFGAQASPWVIVVNQNGTFGRIDPGSSQARLNALNQFAARTAKAPVAKIDFSRAPARDTFG